MNTENEMDGKFSSDDNWRGINVSGWAVELGQMLGSWWLKGG